MQELSVNSKRQAAAATAERRDYHREDGVREPSLNTKRQAAAAAAERREKQFKQGGGGSSEKTRHLAIRREKDELLGKIHELYVALQEDPPLGLNTCDVHQLKAHMAKLKQKRVSRRC
jgi:hypothetical protein